jgi:hypothetical protein
MSEGSAIRTIAIQPEAAAIEFPHEARHDPMTTRKRVIVVITMIVALCAIVMLSSWSVWLRLLCDRRYCDELCKGGKPSRASFCPPPPLCGCVDQPRRALP